MYILTTQRLPLPILSTGVRNSHKLLIMNRFIAHNRTEICDTADAVRRREHVILVDQRPVVELFQSHFFDLSAGYQLMPDRRALKQWLEGSVIEALHLIRSRLREQYMIETDQACSQYGAGGERGRLAQLTTEHEHGLLRLNGGIQR